MNGVKKPFTNITHQEKVHSKTEQIENNNKNHKNVINKKQLEELMDRDGLIDKRYKVAEYHLYSLSGFTDWVKENAVALNVRLIPIEDMYN